MTQFKILLINPPVRVQEPAHHIPYGLAQIAAVSEQFGHNVAILDVHAYKLGIDAVRVEIQRDEWDIIGITGLITQYKYIKQIAPLCKELQPYALLVGGGGFLTSMPKTMLELLPFDVGCVGEGEKTWEEILDHSYDRRFDTVKGIVYRENSVQPELNEKGVLKSHGEIRMTSPRPLMTQEELDALPFPAYKYFPLEDVYFKNSALALSVESMKCQRRLDIISERGCIHECSFCTHLGHSSWDLTRIYGEKVSGPAVRFQSARYVVNLMMHLRYMFACDFFSILDENFTANRKRVLEICDLMEQEDLVGLVQWGCLGSVDTVDYQLLQRMRDCGCRYISYGGENANLRVLKSINKRQTPEQMQAALDATRKAEITPIMTFMICPEDDTESILDTVKFWIRNGITCKPFFCTAYPNTPLFEGNKDRILAQYDGNLDDFLVDLDDATKLTANLSWTFNYVELLGLRELMFAHDVKRIERFGKLIQRNRNVAYVT